MKKEIFKIQNVVPGSIAEELGIEPGDFLLSINGEKIRDVFDYRFLASNDELLLEIQKSSGEIWELELEKDEYEDLGMEFQSSMMDEAHSCTNQCVFCFIDQLPKGMRETLYFKDDDARLSFLTGNYITLTNMGSDDFDRILRYKMSPINISVHTTNPDLRIMMLKNRFAGKVVEQIRQLVAGGIVVNCQVVLCRGINDGQELERTMDDLAGILREEESFDGPGTEIVPGINSLSIVPVGLTRHREGLREMQPFDARSARGVLDQIEKVQKRMLEKYHTRFVYPADEFFILAGESIPAAEYYEDFPQIENGVGLIAMLLEEFCSTLAQMPEKMKHKNGEPRRRVSIATGVSAYNYIMGLAESLEKGYNIKINVYPITNHFFGENVTVTGLLTGQDLVAQLREKELGEALYISRSMLRSGERVFLDDYTVEQVEAELKVLVIPVENSGSDFIECILGEA